MNVSRFVHVFAFVLMFNCIPAHAWDLYDRVIAVVNDRPIVESEVADRFIRIQKKANIPPYRQTAELSRLLDKFIEDSLVFQEAEEQSIIVSDEKVNTHINKIMERMSIPTLDDFKMKLEKTENVSFEDYKEEIRKSLITEQVMSIAIGVSPPTRKEVVEWYESNKDKLGYEVNVKHILLRPKNNTLAEEMRVNEEIKKLLQRVYGGESFETLAMTYSEDIGSAKNGGDLGWVSLGELDPYFANQVFKMYQVGQISDVIKSSFGYHIVKFLGKRPVMIESVEDKIVNMLFRQKMDEQFAKWINQRKKLSEIKIYMQDYVKG